MRKSLACVFALILASACSSPAAKVPDSAAVPKDEAKKMGSRPTALSHEMAWLRAHQLAQVTYGLWFGLDTGSEPNPEFEGRTVINFTLKDLKKSLGPNAFQSVPGDRRQALIRELKELASIIAVDFEGGTLRSVSVNGTQLNTADPKRYDGHRLYFNLSELQPTGPNRIEIAYHQRYSTDGHGLHRFKDPVDGKIYLYTDFEPYYAHRVFPCFDQPDLKASFELTVQAPEDWQVVSNTPERDVANVDGRKSWAFPPSPLLSTYIFAMHAGPYAMWKSDANGIPLRLFARQSLKQYVDPEEWFDPTKRGLAYYANEFGYPYPYSKYDQIIVPEFNEGAMENAGAVTFTEHLVSRTKETLEQRRHRAETILHEMAHMWFGDLVTMKWWNGLWLNESFASFMSMKAMDEATKFPHQWQAFYSGMKYWAYWEDQLVTTHAIDLPVSDTDATKSNFDGITYGKGASTLKQLAFYLGAEDFREGIQRYFQKYALRNTTLHDFMKTLGEASGKDLQKWQKSWFQTAGLNGVRADWACDADGKISKLSLIQAPSDSNPELRTHKTQVALYDWKEHPILRKKEVFTVTYSGAETSVPEALGKACPDFVFPNYEDYDYVKVELDPKSLALVSSHIGDAEDPMLRAMLWDTLSQMVTDGKLRATDYIDTVLNQLAKEKDEQVLTKVLGSVTSTSLNGNGALRYLTGKLRQDYWEKLDAFTMKHLKAAAPGSDLQRIWFNAFRAIAIKPESIAFGRALLMDKAKLSGLPIKQDERWQLVRLLAETGAQDTPALIEAELKRDPTDLGQHEAAIAGAAFSDPASKKQWLDRITAPALAPATAMPISQLRDATWNYQSLRAEDAARASTDTYFNVLPMLTNLSESPYAAFFPGSMFPGLCDPLIDERVKLTLNTHPDLPPETIKRLKIAKQNDERCIRARAKAVSQ